MAAPTTSYKSEKLPVIKGNSSGGIATQNDIYIAKFLQNTTPPSGDDWGDGYFNSTDTEAQKLTKIKDIFKIDGLVLVAKGAADGSAAETGFIGYCNSRNSGNGLYHKTERFSGLKIPIGAAGGGAASTGELLNDAGLNVMGTCSIETIYARWCNYIRFKAIYRSSYYNSTTEHGAIVNGVTWNRGTIGVKTKTDQSFIYLPDDIVPTQSVTLSPFITNEEGTTTNSAVSATALEKIWAASGAGAGVGGGTVYKLTNANDPISESNIYNSNGFFMTLEDFKYLNTLPTSGTLPEEEIIGYKNDSLYDTTTPTKVETGFYYIWNYQGSDTSIPIYGNYQGTSGKVFHATDGEFDYYIARSVSLPTVKVYVDISSASQFTVRAALVSASGGSEVPYNNNLGVNIVITVGARWYNSLTGAAVVASTFTPASRNLTILTGENLSNIVTFNIDDTDYTEAYIGAYEISKTPAPNGSNYSGAVYLRTAYTY